MPRLVCSLALAALLWPAAAGAQGGDEVVYYHTDAIGSVRMTTDAGGAVIARHDFRPFGEAWDPPPTPDPRQFAGKEWDAATRLDYFGARYYDSRTARFTTVDPALDSEQSVIDPQRWNRYAYTWNRPLSMVDPDGREAGFIYLPNGRMLSPYDPGFPRSPNPARDTVGLAALFGGGLFGGPLINTASSLAVEAQIAIGRVLLWSAGAAGTAEQLRHAAENGGPTIRVVTNLRQFPAEGRGLSAAVGDNAQAFANAFRSSDGVRTFAADLPKALIQALQKTRLLEIRDTVTPNGVRGTEYRFAPGAYKYIVKFFEEIPR
jgi:RHS repeat-associated protein